MTHKVKRKNAPEKSHSQVLWLAIVSAALGLTFLRSTSQVNGQVTGLDREPASVAAEISRIAPTINPR